MTSAPPRSTTTSSHRLPTSPKAHNRTLPAVCSGAFCASLVLEPYLSQGLPHPSPLRGELLKLWCSPGALLHPQGDPGDHNCIFHHTCSSYFHQEIIRKVKRIIFGEKYVPQSADADSAVANATTHVEAEP